VARRGGAGRHGCRRDARPALEVIHDATKRSEAEGLDAARRGLARVGFGHQHLTNAANRRMANPWHRASNRPQRAVERELAETERGDVYLQLPARAEDPKGDRELEPGSFLAALGRREIHRDPAERELKAGVPDGRTYALPRFLHRGVGKTDDDQGRQTVRDVDLDGHESRLETPERARGHTRD